MFTTSAAFGGDAMSVCGQIADRIYLDESDYITDTDFDLIFAISWECKDIGALFFSSTPIGARKCFWQCCTDPKMHFHEENEFRTQSSEQGYRH